MVGGKEQRGWRLLGPNVSPTLVQKPLTTASSSPRWAARWVRCVVWQQTAGLGRRADARQWPISQMADFPLDPKLARVLLATSRYPCRDELLR